VLENYDGTPENPGELMSLSIMYQIESYNPDGDDWFWLQTEIPSNDIRVEEIGGFCQVCHVGDGRNDYIQSYPLLPDENR